MNTRLSKVLALFACSMTSAIAGTTNVPKELEVKKFAGADMTPSPACICAAPTGEVFVGVDMQGSLGKKVGLGKIVKLIDTDNDGKADKAIDFAKINNPRGLIAVGDKVYCLHTIVAEDGKIDTQRLSVYTDADNDGVADGPPKPLLKNIGNGKFVRFRGADHCTNNIRLAIDGWIYISVGDFGFVDAVGSDGKKLSMLGGGIVRVRPDGSEVETFIHGTRNVYDVAIDPFMNMYCRENTNDGVGWWVRFSHYIQTGQYGYPSLYTNFPEDMIPALGEFGSGSGTGALFLDEPGWPEKYNKMPLMADWGKSHIFIHRHKADGASFTQTEEKFIHCSQVADLDIDGSGRMFIAAWDGAGYSGNTKVGYISQVTPKGWVYKPFPNLKKATESDLLKLLASDSFTARVYAQQEILTRKDNGELIKGLVQHAASDSASPEAKVAAVYTLSQYADVGQKVWGSLYKDEVIREHVVRAMTDRVALAEKADVALLLKALDDSNPRVQVAAAVALGRAGDQSVAPALLAKATPVPVKGLVKQVEIKSAKSKVITKQQTVDIDVDISAYPELVLVVDPSGDNGSDHAAWIEPTVVLEDGRKIDLTQTGWKSASQAWGRTAVGKDCTGKPLAEKKSIGTHAQSSIVFELPKGAKKFTAKGILTNANGSVAFVVASGVKSGSKAHSTPNSAAVLPHVARQALLALDATDACIAALDAENKDLQRAALNAMKFMHSEKVVDALIAKAKTTQDAAYKELIVKTLVRLHQKEIDYDGSTWWNTRPDPHGPYYYPVDWAGTEAISAFLTSHHAALDSAAQASLVKILKKNRAYVAVLNPRPGGDDEKKPTKIKDESIENILIYLNSHKGNVTNGSKVITKVGCAGCHNIRPKDVVKAPDLAKMGDFNREIIAEGILKPSASIAKSWVNVTTKDGMSHLGTMTEKTKKHITVNNMAGMATKLDANKVKSVAPGLDMMSHHLCDDLTLQEFTDLVDYIRSMDSRPKKVKSIVKPVEHIAPVKVKSIPAPPITEIEQKLLEPKAEKKCDCKAPKVALFALLTFIPAFLLTGAIRICMKKA